MPTWTTDDFEARATAIAKQFLSSGTSLDVLAEKTAREATLNPDQIDRLCRLVNVRVFEEKFASTKGQEDRIPEFEVCSAEAVRSKVAGAEKTAQFVRMSATPLPARYPSLPNAFRPPPPPLMSKTASVSDALLSIKKAAGPSASPAFALLSAEKTAAELRGEMALLSSKWTGAVQELGRLSKMARWNQDNFEKDALALHGAAVLPELNAFRQQRGLPPHTFSAEKVAGIQDRIFGVESDATRLIKTASAHREAYVTIQKRLDETQTRIANLRKDVFRGAV
jgi:hypothetical protein